jgi:hypothetical protein
VGGQKIIYLLYKMPFSVVPVGKSFKIYNDDKRKYVNKTFATVQSAKNMITNYNNYERKKALDIPKWNKKKNLKGYV